MKTPAKSGRRQEYAQVGADRHGSNEFRFADFLEVPGLDPDKTETTNRKHKILNNKSQINSKLQYPNLKKGQKPKVDCHFDFSNIDDWNALSSRS